MDVVPPNRTTHTYTQHLLAPPSDVFPLLCPVRERDWVQGWEPGLVVSSTGVVEQDCIFTTFEDEAESTWYVTRHEPDDFFVEMIRVAPGRLAVRLDIQLEDETTNEGSHGCAAQVRYTYTALGKAGEEEVARMTLAEYERFMKGWQRALNHYLMRGEKLRG